MVMKIDDKTILLEDGRTLGNAEYGELEGNPVFHFNGSGGSRLEHPAEQPVFINQPWGFTIEQIKIRINNWQGEVDKKVPLNQGLYQHNLIPNSRLTILPGEAHLHILSRWGEVLAALIE